MAETGPIIIHLSANTRLVKPVGWALYPFVWLGFISAERAIAFAMRFARVEAKVEGLGGIRG